MSKAERLSKLLESYGWATKLTRGETITYHCRAGELILPTDDTKFDVDDVVDFFEKIGWSQNPPATEVRTVLEESNSANFSAKRFFNSDRLATSTYKDGSICMKPKDHCTQRSRVHDYVVDGIDPEFLDDTIAGLNDVAEGRVKPLDWVLDGPAE